jgi:hypothetical protein
MNQRSPEAGTNEIPKNEIPRVRTKASQIALLNSRSMQATFHSKTSLGSSVGLLNLPK